MHSKHQLGGAVPDARRRSPEKTAGYIADIAGELAQLARAEGFSRLAASLSDAQKQAEEAAGGETLNP